MPYWHIPYEGEVKDLICPDCGTAGMLLTASQYGLFYGCPAYGSTGCKGSVTADNTTGKPFGRPVPAAHRRLRAQIIILRKRVKKANLPYDLVSIQDMDVASCVQHIRLLRALLGEYPIWERLLDDD